MRKRTGTFIGVFVAMAAVAACSSSGKKANLAGGATGLTKDPMVYPLRKLPAAQAQAGGEAGRATASARYRAYDGPAVDINFINTKPAKYRICDKYSNDNTARRYQACEFGRDEAERMAERFGGGNGRIEGFLRGYTWGLHRAAKAAQGDPESVKAGRAAVSQMGQFMESGLEAGRAEGRKVGESRGRADAISRFESVMNSGKNPDPTLRVPEARYAGETGAYRRFVGPVPSVETIIRKDIKFDDFPVYHDYDATYLGDVTPLSIWDLWSRDGTYVFEKARWFDGNRAFSTWLERPIDTKPQYQQLDATPLDPASVPAGTPATLKEVFAESFRESYVYYVNYYFSAKFYENLDYGQFTGEQAGTQIGKRVAYFVGLEAAFDEQFRVSSVTTYKKAHDDRYTSVFNSVFNEYNTKPQLSVRFDDAIGEIVDGVLQPGERVAAKFSVWNKGGVPANLTATLGGQVTGAASQAFQIGRLSSQQFTTGIIGAVDPSLRAGDVADIKIVVNGVTDSIRRDLRNTIEIVSITPTWNIVGGHGAAIVSVKNISTVDSAAEAKVTLSLGGAQIFSQSAGKIPTGETREVALVFENRDPLALLKNGLAGKVVLTLLEREIDSRPIEFRAETGDRRSEVVRYYTELLKGAPTAFVPARVDRNARIAEVTKFLVDENHGEVLANLGSGNLWRDSANSSMVGQLAFFRSSEQLSTNQSVALNELAKLVYRERGHFGKFLGIKSGKRSAYEDLCEAMWDKHASGGRELSQFQQGQHQGQGQR